MSLNLSQNFIVTDFGKLIAFPLNITLTSFQSTSLRYLKFNVSLALPLSGVNIL